MEEDMLRLPPWMAALATAACTTVAAPQPRTPAFPSPASLRAFQTDTASATRSFADRPTLKRFELEGPGFTSVQTLPPPEELQPSFDRRRAPDWLYTRAMVCAAEKVAGYLAEAQGPPPLHVLQRVGPVCGTTASHLNHRYWVLENAPELSVERVGAVTARIFEEGLDELQENGRLELGYGVHEAEAQLYLVLAWGGVSALVETAQLEETELTVAGRLQGPVDIVIASVTHGPLGYRDCTSDPELSLPRFRVVCPVDKNDLELRFNLSSAPQGRILADLDLSLAFSRNERLGPEILRPTDSDGGPTPQALTDAINEARKRADLPPLELQSSQSAFNKSVTPRFFEEQEGGDAEVLETIMRGVVAGYQVSGPILNADFTSRVLPWSTSTVAVLSALLEEPSSRRLLMSPEADRVAFGLGGDPSSGVLGLLISSYQGFEPEDAEAYRARAMEILDRERSARGLEPLQPIELVGNKSMAERVIRQEVGVQALVRDYIRQGTRRRPGQAVGVIAQEVHDLERWVPDPELLSTSALAAEVDLIIFRPLGARWHTILIVVTRTQSSAAGDVLDPSQTSAAATDQSRAGIELAGSERPARPQGVAEPEAQSRSQEFDKLGVVGGLLDEGIGS